MVAKKSRDLFGAAWARSQASFLFSFAAIPALLTEFIRGLEEHFSWVLLVLILVAVVAASYSYSYLLAHREGRPLTVDHGRIDGIPDLSAIEVLVATVDMSKPDVHDKAVHVLVRQLPRLRTIHLVMGPASAAAERQAADSFERWLRDIGKMHLTVGATCSIGALTVAAEDSAKVDVLLQEAGSAAVVDVTGGTVAMSLATYQAARRRDLRVTYTVAPGHGSTRVFQALVDISGDTPATVPPSPQAPSGAVNPPTDDVPTQTPTTS